MSQSRFILPVVLACAGFWLSACTSQPLVGDYVPPVAACCSKVSDYGFQPLALGKETDFSLAENGPTLTIDGRRGFFAGFSIRADIVASAAVVKSYLSTGFLPKATAVVPELVFYDADLQRIGSTTVSNMQSDNGFWRSSISGRVAVPNKTRHIVIIAGNGAKGRTLIRSENGTPYYLPPAALGDLSIRLFGEAESR